MHEAPKWSAVRVPFQRAAALGARQRRSPMGGAAYGMPLKLTTAPSAAGTPETAPKLVLTTLELAGGSADKEAVARTRSSAQTDRVFISFLKTFRTRPDKS